MFKNTRITFLAFAIGIFLSFPIVAMAANTTSPNKYFGPYVGYSYFNYSGLDNTNGVVADGVVCTQSGTVPAGYMGISGYLYDDATGVCKANTAWKYNTSASGGIAAYTSSYKVSGHYYYAKGLSQVYNGDGYTSQWTYQSPKLYY